MLGKVKALILAGGAGTRLRPLTDTVPKCLIPIAGQPLLDVWVECLVEAGILEARINTHALAEAVRAISSKSTPKAGSAWSRRTSRCSWARLARSLPMLIWPTVPTRLSLFMPTT